MDIFKTIVAGFSVYVFGQMAIRLVLDPVVKFKEKLGELSSLLIKEHQRLQEMNVEPETQYDLVVFCSEILASKRSVPCYSLIARVLRLPQETSVIEACEALHWIAQARMTGPRLDEQRSMAQIEMINKLRLIGGSLGIYTGVAKS